MATDLCEGDFNQILLKMAKNDHWPSPHFEDNKIF